MKKFNMSIFLFYLSYTLMVVYFMCGQVKILFDIKNYIYFMIPILLVLLIIFQSKTYSFKSILLMVCSIFVFFISYRISRNSLIFISLLFILASKNVDIEDFIKYDFKLKLFLLVSVIILYFLGFTNVILKSRIDGTIRYALGFGHANVLGVILFTLCSDLAFLHYKKIKFKEYLFFLISFLICTFVCDSRAAQFGILILFILLIFLPKVEKILLVNKIIPFLPIILMGLSYLGAILFNGRSDFILKLNDLTSTRIKCTSDFLNYYGVNMFGHYFEYYGLWNIRSYLTVLDNSYMNMLLQFGLATTVFVILGLFISLKKAVKEKKYALIMCFIALMLYGLMENYSYMIGYNAILIYMSCLIYNKKGKDNNEENSNDNISLII